ncbi:MAG TPA: excinuclease ABC subunit UvrC [Pseudobacteroides sp.]|uniref:excinuclease ABC subunit UvrC n=1 Tax=Pseudobacteroides sp. TaxID=1968840 RepID=UPI002F922E58
MFNIQEELKKMPDKPGVYIMKDENEQIIYIGKAVVLKNRVRQYFQSSANMPPKVKAMVARIAEFEYIVTNSELEALILECNLIKKHKPKFNILLKDDKTYPYIKVTMNEEYPRVLMTRRLEKDGAKYFGPYSNVSAVRETIDLLKKLFPIKTCNKVFPRDVGKERPCLNYYIYQCLGPCMGNVNKEDYRNLMKDICSFLAGKHDEVIAKLEKQMNGLAENLDFEKAASLRDKIRGLKHVAEKQKVLSTAMEDQDVIAYAKNETDSCIQVFFIRGGKLLGREHFIFEGVGEVEDKELITSFVKQFYSATSFIPQEILLQEDIDEINIIEKWLADKRSGKVYIKVPRKGDKHKLIEMVSQNAMLALNQFRDKVARDEAMSKDGLKELASLVSLKEPPQRIEAYDISNTGTSEIVASMVVFENGHPANREYRRFKIKSVEGQNDYGSMQETIFRRFKPRLEEDSKHSSKFSKMPDLILIDGGLGHINAVKEVMNKMNIDIPAYGMVKDDKHKTRALMSQAGEISFGKDINAFRLVTAIQNEAHRFAVDYNKKLREMRYRKSALDEVPGIGPKRKKALIKHFGSVSKIKEAQVDDLEAVEGITNAVAVKIYEYFH